jgi:hypothetical protein
MSTLTVGPGQQYSTISAAVAAASSGDTVDVEAGTYTNDFTTISRNITLQAVGGTVYMNATQSPPDGKAIIDEGGSGVSVTIQGFDISGSQVSAGNGAAIRYEGGNLTLNNVNIHDNQEGLLSAADPNGNITISNSTFSSNGTGDGATHDIYVGAVNSLTVQNSTVTDADVGHEIKSRAANTTITGNTITDGPNGTSSYEIDLPNGGNATITGNVIEKGANAQNPNSISFGEEGNVYSSSSLNVSGNIMLNDDPSSSSTGVQNTTGVTASITGNQLYGWNSLVSGPASVSNNTTLTSEPALSSLSPSGSSSTVAASSGGTADASTSTTSSTTTASTPDTSSTTVSSTPDTSTATAASTPDTSTATTASTPDTSSTTTASTPDTSGSTVSSTPETSTTTAASTPDTSGSTTTSTDAGTTPITADNVGSSTSTPSFTSGDTDSGTATGSSTSDTAASPATSSGDQLTSAVTQAQTTTPTVGTTPTHNYAMGSSDIFPGWHSTYSPNGLSWHALHVSTGSNG